MASARFPDPTFRDYRAGWRMREVSRLEGLSDAVFGFALTLLVVSLEVPRTSADLLERTFVGVVPLALTFSFLFATWYAQHRSSLPRSTIMPTASARSSASRSSKSWRLAGRPSSTCSARSSAFSSPRSTSGRRAHVGAASAPSRP